MPNRELWWEYSKLQVAHPQPDSLAKIEYYQRNSAYLRAGGGKPEAAVVVVAHNEQDYLPRALAGLNQAVGALDGKKQVEIIVVDNASTDATRDVGQAYGVKIVDEPSKGIGRARQTGLTATSSTVRQVLSTDADTVVGEDWIRRYLEALGEEGLVLAYGRIRGEFDSRASLDLKLQREILRVGGASLRLMRKIKNVGLCVCSGNLAFMREAAMRVGGYDPNLKGGEDGNLQGKLERVGKVRFVEGVDVLHSRRRQVGEGIMASAVIMAIDEVRRSLGKPAITDLQKQYSSDYR